MSSPPHKLIIDTDPGIDDAMAILYAAQAPDIELLGLTTIFGNVTVDQATRNALVLLDMAGLDAPVARGCARPLVAGPFAPSAHVHGAEGFGSYPAMTPKRAPSSLDAADFLIAKAAEFPGQVTLCPIGPLTNVATALHRDPAFAANLKSIVLMGGSLHEGGNISPHAEANFYHDPHAAQIVMAADCDVTMVGLDATHRTWATRDDMAAIAAAAPRQGTFLADIANFYIDFYVQVRGEQGCFLHDPLAILCVTHPDLFDYESVPVDVVLAGEAAGKSFIAQDGTRKTQKVAVGIRDSLKPLLMTGLKRMDADD